MLLNFAESAKQKIPWLYVTGFFIREKELNEDK